MADGGGSKEDSVLAGFLSDNSDLQALESLDAAFTTQSSSRSSFRARHFSDSVDIEVDLPEVENVPTLESILNEKDDDFSGLESDPELASILHDEALSLPLNLHLIPKQKEQSKHGVILRHIILKNVSSQMVSACSKVDAGLPTAILLNSGCGLSMSAAYTWANMAVSTVIAIGTSHGIILIFDPNQTLKLVLGNTSLGGEYGAVTALGINEDCTRLLCGHARGQIIMWDLQTGKLLRTILDAHPLRSAVLHIMFTDDPTVAICSDSGGSVFILNFKRLMAVRSYESTCLFSGSRGEVCSMAPLRLHSGMKDHPMFEYSLLALATLTKVLVLTLKPTMEVLFTHALRGPVDTLPLVSWQFAIIQVANKKIIDPVLAFARGSNIFFFQSVNIADLKTHYLKQQLAGPFKCDVHAHCTGDKEIKFIFLQKTERNYKLIALHWLNAHVIAALDNMEKIHVLDVRTFEELELLDLSTVQLVYSSSYFKSLSTGGNVSKALAAASEHSCYQTVCVFNGQMLFLGNKSIHVLTIRTWTDRVSFLARLSKFQEALELALSFYTGTAKAIVGLIGNQEIRQREVAAEICELLLTYADVVMFTNRPPGNNADTLKSYFKEFIPVFIKYCLAVKQMELLFRDIYYKFCEHSIGKVTFLESLEPYIMNDKLTSLSAIVMKDFIEHYQAIGRVKEVESCLLHLDVYNLDIHQMVNLCWSHSLYDAILYVYNHGMRDYTTPLEELLGVLRSALQSGKQLTDQDQALGYKMLVYISCSLAGRAFPRGEIPTDIVTVVKKEVFNCLTAYHTRDAFESEPTYPYLRVLLEFDTQEFLNVLSLAFEEKEFDDDFRGPDNTSGRQYVVNILLQVMVQNTGFSPTQVGSLFTFLARQMAKHENTIHVNKVLFEQVLEYLANPDDDSRHEERQQALLELLVAGGLRQFDDERILVLAENAKFYRVCEMLYERKRQFAKVLLCYFRDTARKDQAFKYIESVMTDDIYTDIEREEVREAALNSLKELVSISCLQMAHLVLVHFPNTLATVVYSLEDQPKTQYEFLKGVFDSRSPVAKQELIPDVDVHEKYIDLMCQHEHDHAVFNYLRASDNFRIEETLAIVRGYSFTYATAYLLEKAGDVHGAFQLLLETLNEKVKIVVTGFEKQQQFKDMRKGFSDLWAVMIVITQLCQRNSARLDEDDREALWFPLLESVMAPQRKCQDTSCDYFSAFKDLTRHVMNSMMGYISLPAILQKIMQDPTYSSGKFGEIKELILGMLDTYTYESTLLKTTNSLLENDLYTSMNHLRKSLEKGIAPQGLYCHICGRQFSNIVTNKDDIAIFRCGHTYDVECLQGSDHLDSPDNMMCILCHKGKISRVPSRKGKTAARKIDDRQTTKGGETQSARADKTAHHGLDPQRFEMITRMRRQDRGPSRLAILTELSRTRDDNPFTLSYGSSSSSTQSIFQDESFGLRLVPPLPQRDRDEKPQCQGRITCS